MDHSKLKVGTILKANTNAVVMQRAVKVDEGKWKVLITLPEYEDHAQIGVGCIVNEFIFRDHYEVDYSYVIDKVLNKYSNEV